jgi:hypothetical protein
MIDIYYLLCYKFNVNQSSFQVADLNFLSENAIIEY